VQDALTPSVVAPPVRVGTATHRGLHRRVNEDSVLARCGVYAVADGMGGHAAGDVASAITVEELAALDAGGLDVDAVTAALDRAHARVLGLASDGRPGAGTTVTALVGVEQAGVPYWLVAHLGDSRAYLLSDGVLRQVSVDHSVVQELVDAGRLSPDETRSHPQRHVVTRAVGGPEGLEPDFWLLPSVEGDRLVLCSDGLTAEVPDARITEVLLAHPDPQAAADALVQAALDAGGHDNVSVVVVDVHGPATAAGTRPRATAEDLPAGVEDTVPRPAEDAR